MPAPNSPDNSSNPVQVTVPQMVRLPAGAFWMGTSPEQVQLLLKEEWAQEWYEQELFLIEQPQHSVALPAYEIARLPVTNNEYYLFIYETGFRVPRGWDGFYHPAGKEQHPVTGVNKSDALAYCQWLSKQTGQAYRLPTEAEWERAARGSDARNYPWGSDFDPWRCNTVESGKRGTTPVGEYSPRGDSPFGLADMAGNIWEWTSSALQPYPYQPGDGREQPRGVDKCVVRGGAWYYSRKLARCSAREGVLPNYTSPALGFRLARTP